MPFDPAKRITPQEIDLESREVLTNEHFSSLLEDIHEILMILNEHRQIVYLNKDIFKQLNIPAIDACLGLRPGECLACVNAYETENGCGSTPQCTVCGLAKAIQASETGNHGHEESSILLRGGGALSLEILTRSFTLNDKNYIFCALIDISEIKRKENIEDVFLHDLMNRVSSINSLLQLREHYGTEKTLELIGIQNDRLVDEINAHRILLDAETRKLKPRYQEIDTDKVIHEAVNTTSTAKEQPVIPVVLNLCGARITSDKTLLTRVIINLLKNALEASTAGENVYINTSVSEEKLILTVNNREVLEEHVLLMMFHRSFTTKGSGRGYGTYGVKLITEQYLQGTVTVHSDNSNGTTFTITLPIKLSV